MFVFGFMLIKDLSIFYFCLYTDIAMNEPNIAFLQDRKLITGIKKEILDLDYTQKQ